MPFIFDSEEGKYQRYNNGDDNRQSAAAYTTYEQSTRERDIILRGRTPSHNMWTKNPLRDLDSKVIVQRKRPRLWNELIALFTFRTPEFEGPF
jgi:hypothetical protein